MNLLSDCSRLNRTNIFISSANNRHVECSVTIRRSLIIILQRTEPNTSPCGTSERTSKSDEYLKFVSKLVLLTTATTTSTTTNGGGDGSN